MKHCILINFYPNFNIKLDSDPENYCINTGRYHCNALIHIVVIFLLMMILNRHCIILARWLNVNIKLHCLVLLQRRDKWTFPMAHIVVNHTITIVLWNSRPPIAARNDVLLQIFSPKITLFAEISIQTNMYWENIWWLKYNLEKYNICKVLNPARNISLFRRNFWVRKRIWRGKVRNYLEFHFWI